MRRLGGSLAASLVLLVGACSDRPGSEPSSPYADLVDRDIAALSEEEVAELRSGGGLGFALAAELNGYPGPMHVLELREDLGLTEEQQRAVSSIQERMHERGSVLGRRLVLLERELDRAFEGGEITSATLSRLTARIAETEGLLRAAHLAAHLRTRALLSEHQTQMYDRLRGYSGEDHADHDEHGS